MEPDEEPDFEDDLSFDEPFELFVLFEDEAPPVRDEFPGSRDWAPESTDPTVEPGSCPPGGAGESVQADAVPANAVVDSVRVSAEAARVRTVLRIMVGSSLCLGSERLRTPTPLECAIERVSSSLSVSISTVELRILRGFDSEGCPRRGTPAARRTERGGSERRRSCGSLRHRALTGRATVTPRRVSVTPRRTRTRASGARRCASATPTVDGARGRFGSRSAGSTVRRFGPAGR